ncbi:MAG TPA: hypothetical protein VFD52_08860 [Clostridia bacterium]|nr:hypothetical protein [Clostridia bacterium]
MNKKIRIILSFFLAVCLVAVSFAACGSGDDDVTLAAPDDTWKPAVETNEQNDLRLSDDEIKSIIEKVIGEEDEGYEWQGDYSKLTKEQKNKIEDKIYKEKGIRVIISDKGIVYDKTVPTYEEIVEAVNSTVGDELKEQKNDDNYVWNGDYSELTQEQKEKIEKELKDDGYDVVIDDNGVSETPPEPISDTVLVGFERDNLQTFGGSGHDRFMAVTATSDGGYAALINTYSKDGDCSIADNGWSRNISGVVKYNAQGVQQWKKLVGGNNDVTLSAIAELVDGSIVCAGYTTATNISGLPKSLATGLDGLIVKYSADGKNANMRLVVGEKGEYFSSIAATPDGGFVVGGKTESSDNDFEGLTENSIKSVLFKYDKDFKLYWKRALASGKKHSNFQALSVNEDGYIFATCLSMSDTDDFETLTNFGNGDSVVVKYDKNGQMQWHKSIVGVGNDDATSILATKDGGCLVGGKYNSSTRNTGTFAPYHNYGAFDGFYIKYDSSGKMTWLKTLKGIENEEIKSMIEVDGGYVLCGTSQSDNMDFALAGNKGRMDAYILLTDEAGKKIELKTLAGINSESFNGLAALNENTFVVVGGTQSSDGDYKGLSPAGNEDAYICVSAIFKTVKK